VRTPWKVLYDWSVAILNLKLGPNPQAAALLWIVCVGGPIAIAVWVVSAFANWITPRWGFSEYLKGHYWPIVLVSCVLFFFYFFFRLVWDGLREPTAQEERNK
jgi:hypothetical protein